MSATRTLHVSFSSKSKSDDIFHSPLYNLSHVLNPPLTSDAHTYHRHSQKMRSLSSLLLFQFDYTIFCTTSIIWHHVGKHLCRHLPTKHHPCAVSRSSKMPFLMQVILRFKQNDMERVQLEKSIISNQVVNTIIASPSLLFRVCNML